MRQVALDTSVAVPLLLASHPAHRHVVTWATGRDLVLTGHSLAETYSVLTRLPEDARLEASDARDLISANISTTLVLDASQQVRVPATLAAAGVVGGAVYDGLVALAAVEHGVPLATRDARATETYRRLGAMVKRVG